MKNSRLVGIVFCLLFGLFAVSMNANATDKKASKTKSKVASKKVVQAPFEPFDTTIDKLSKNFLGHDIKRIYTALTKSEQTFKKDEYESNDTYNARLLDIRNRNLLDKFTYNDSYVFVHKEVNSKYYADSKIPKIIFTIGNNYRERDIDAFTISEMFSSYLGSNAYGASIKIVKRKLVKCAFEISNWAELREAINGPSGTPNGTSGMMSLALGLEVPPERAKYLKENGTFLFVYKLVPPYFMESTSSTSPTFDFPKEEVVTKRNIQVEVLEVWLFDSSTGEIIKKIKV